MGLRLRVESLEAVTETHWAFLTEGQEAGAKLARWAVAEHEYVSTLRKFTLSLGNELLDLRERVRFLEQLLIAPEGCGGETAQ